MPPAAARLPVARALPLALVLAAAVAGCGSGTPSSPSPTPSVDASPSATSASGSPSPSSSPVAAVPWDEKLLARLPAEVDGLPLTPESDAFAESAADPALVRDAGGGVVAFVMDPATDDYAVSFVYRLRDGVFDEAWFRDWRDSFDEGVCDQAGGVTGKAEAELGGRTVHIGSCAGGVLTYHAHLETADGDVIVSSQSLGETRLGEGVMAGLSD